MTRHGGGCGLDDWEVPAWRVAVDERRPDQQSDPQDRYGRDHDEKGPEPLLDVVRNLMLAQIENAPETRPMMPATAPSPSSLGARTRTLRSFSTTEYTPLLFIIFTIGAHNAPRKQGGFCARQSFCLCREGCRSRAGIGPAYRHGG
jgi:hypothetical protein